MRLRTLLETRSLGLRLLSGDEELDRPVRGVMTTDLRDPSRYLSGGELVLTGIAWHREAADSEPFVRRLVAAGVAGLAAGEAEQGAVPDDLVQACARHRLPLFSVSEDVAFASITEHILRQVSTERAGDLAAVVDRHRRLVASGPTGGGPEAVLDLLGSDLDLRAWVLSPTGRQIAGADTPLPRATRAELAAAHLAAHHGGRAGPHRATVDGAPYSLFPVHADTRRHIAPRLADWLLVVAADAGEWPAERRELLTRVTRLIAEERERGDAARTVRRELAREVLELIQSGAPPTEIATRLRVASPVLLPGHDAAPRWQVVVAGVAWRRGGAEDGLSARDLLEEVLTDPAAAGPASDRNAVTHTGEEAVALVPLDPLAPGSSGTPDEPGPGTPDEPPPDGPAPAGSTATGLDAGALRDALRPALGHGLGDDGGLTLGISAVVDSAEGLRGALEEARHARRVAAAHSGPVRVAGHGELASHVLLLPFVPDDVRRAFTARLLDPLHAYDQRHRAELVDTLDAFLTADGSWTRCAAQLHLHVNTLRYRIGRIEQLTGRDLSRLEDKLDFFLALRMR
ncbi:PucR family transcriptional regulator [Streptomyces sp. AJS327]|uniref:PucR family transcriptional regulator n=1 Tax=Streptomyces sp. AJS327 TaxID=2545265 RepID=UPI0015DF473A|nr:PucR family transcriptional regulator ligand-binding domain-containing protein [Streptomyces sp. AJS327]MBA0052108.1 PucR family transcriptional regulator [Streptomyces sp. AJS327]